MNKVQFSAVSGEREVLPTTLAKMKKMIEPQLY